MEHTFGATTKHNQCPSSFPLHASHTSFVTACFSTRLQVLKVHRAMSLMWERTSPFLSAYFRSGDEDWSVQYSLIHWHCCDTVTQRHRKHACLCVKIYHHTPGIWVRQAYSSAYRSYHTMFQPSLLTTLQHTCYSFVKCNRVESAYRIWHKCNLV